MNLFLLSLDPEENARLHCDQHVVKMILEAVQLLCTCLHTDRALGHVPRTCNKGELARIKQCVSDGSVAFYKPTHVNHPLAVWTRTCRENYEFVKEYAMSLGREYTFRYGKTHKSAELCKSLPEPENLPCHGNITPHVICMDVQYQVSSDPVACYRNYYSSKEFARYSRREWPEWFHKM